MHSQIKDLLSFLDASPTAVQASAQILKRLEAAGFAQLDERSAWNLKKGGKYYIQRADTAVIAFVMGSTDLARTGFQLAASHIDSPLLKLKPESLKSDGMVTRVGVEVYGGPIIATWTDRELSIAGKALLRKNGKVTAHSVNLKDPVAIIPNAAIHLNREVNNGFVYNKQTHLQAILNTGKQEGNPLLAAIAAELKAKPEQIAELELYLYDPQPATLAGLDSSLVVSGRLDNLAMTHAILCGITSVGKPKNACVAVFYDHEEIGSQTLQGAASSLLAEALDRISLALALPREQHYLALRSSFLISTDMAHAFHPAYPEKYEPSYAPAMNQGPVIKINANGRYTSTAESSERFLNLCEKAKAGCQKFLVRSDMPCGSTVGPVVSASLGIPAVDVGNPMWAMHSARETAGVEDHLALIRVLAQYFE